MQKVGVRELVEFECVVCFLKCRGGVKEERRESKGREVAN